MVRGARPKPAALRKAAGNAGKRPINDSVKSNSGIPIPPPHLVDAAVEEWERVAPLLEAMGILGLENRATLAIYCQNWARMIDAEANVSKYGAVVPAPRTGVPMHNPYLAIANKSAEIVARMSVEFGMTPSARTRVHGTKTDDKKDDPAAQFFA